MKSKFVNVILVTYSSIFVTIISDSNIGLSGKWSSWGNNALNSQTSTDASSLLTSSTIQSLTQNECVYTGNEDNTGFFGFVTVDDDYNAYFGEYNTGYVTSISLIDCTERWRINIAVALGLSSSLKLVSRNTLTLFDNSNGEQGVIFGSTNSVNAADNSGWGIHSGCYVLALSTIDGSLMWKTLMGNGPDFAACQIQGLMVEENDKYAYGGMSSLGNWRNFSLTSFNGKFWKMDIDNGSIIHTYRPIPANKVALAINNTGYTGSGIWGFPAIIDDYVIFGVGNLYTIPDYVIDCLNGSININYTTNPINPCGEDESQFLEYKCREDDVIFDSYVILNKNTFNIETQMHINGIDAWVPLCTNLPAGFVKSKEMYCTAPEKYQTFPQTPEVMSYPDTDVVAISAYYDINNKPMGVIHAKSGQFIQFSIPSGEVYSAQKLGPWTTGGGGSTSLAADDTSKMAIATQTGGFFFGDSYAMIYPYTLPDNNIVYAGGVIYGINLTSGNILWETPNPNAPLNNATLCDKFPFCKNYDDPTTKGICEKQPALFSTSDSIATTYINITDLSESSVNKHPISWRTRAQIKGGSVIANDLVFIPTFTGEVFVLNLYTGKHLLTLTCPDKYYADEKLWNRPAIYAVSVVEDRVLYFCGAGGSSISITSPKSGNQLVSIQFVQIEEEVIVAHADGYNYFSIVFTMILFFIATAFVTHAFMRFCCAKQNDSPTKKMKQPDRVTVILCCVALLLMSICMFVCILITFGIFVDAEYVFITQYSAYLTFNIGLGCVYSLFLNTLHITFRNSAYNYNIYFKIGFGAFIWIFLIVLIVVDSYAYF
eukprot:156168_1